MEKSFSNCIEEIYFNRSVPLMYDDFAQEFRTLRNNGSGVILVKRDLTRKKDKLSNYLFNNTNEAVSELHHQIASFINNNSVNSIKLNLSSNLAVMMLDNTHFISYMIRDFTKNSMNDVKHKS